MNMYMGWIPRQIHRDDSFHDILWELKIEVIEIDASAKVLFSVVTFRNSRVVIPNSHLPSERSYLALNTLSGSHISDWLGLDNLITGHVG